MVIFEYWPLEYGAQRQTRILSKSLQGKDIKVSVVTGRFRLKKSFELVQGIPVKRLSCFPWFRGLRKFGEFFFMVNLLVYLLRNRRCYDLIHTQQGIFPAFVSALVGKLTNIPTVTTFRLSGDFSDLKYLESKPFGSLMKRYLLQNTDRIVYVNDELGEELRRQAGARPQKIIKISNGIELNSLQSLQIKERGDINGEALVIYSGRMTAQKNLETLLHAWTEVIKIYPRARLILLGDGEYQRVLERRVKEFGITGSVTFEGYVEDVYPFLVKADIFVLPSLAEGVSNSLLEAMLLGLPSVVSDIPPNRELVEDGLNGFIFKTGDPMDLAQKLALLLSMDKKERQLIGQRGRQRVIEGFDIEVIASKYIDVYYQLLNRTSQ